MRIRVSWSCVLLAVAEIAVAASMVVPGRLEGQLTERPEIDFEKGSWRYRFETPRMAAVVAFLDENSLTVVSAWRK